MGYERFGILMPATMGLGKASHTLLRYELQRYYSWMKHISPIQTRFPEPVAFLEK